MESTYFTASFMCVLSPGVHWQHARTSSIIFLVDCHHLVDRRSYNTTPLLTWPYEAWFITQLLSLSAAFQLSSLALLRTISSNTWVRQHLSASRTNLRKLWALIEALLRTLQRLLPTIYPEPEERMWVSTSVFTACVISPSYSFLACVLSSLLSSSHSPRFPKHLVALVFLQN